MLKVNVFAQYPKGGSFYKTEYCTATSTVLDVLERCGLTTLAASIYLNGDRLSVKQWEQPLNSFRIGPVSFLSLRYGEFRN